MRGKGRGGEGSVEYERKGWRLYKEGAMMARAGQAGWGKKMRVRLGGAFYNLQALESMEGSTSTPLSGLAARSGAGCEFKIGPL